MCGIFGYFDSRYQPLSMAALERMGDTIRYRGPDGRGIFHDPHKAVGIGNQRLAILDIAHGQQPFYSNDGQISIVQNGEIFNHVELSAELSESGFPCATNCDTEVILRLYERDGIAGLSKLNGMFAIAIYDARLDELYLIRDRVGEKPLYFLNNQGRVVFASEIKAILEVCEEITINFEALSHYLTLNYVPPPFTMFQGIQHVMPGTYLRISRGSIETVVWWDLANVITEDRDEADWTTSFNEVLRDAVRIRLRSDVDFGAFLSGGVDSSTVVGLMSEMLNTPVNTFCIGFNDHRYDESEFAANAAERFGTNHVSSKVNPNMIDLWPLATYHCDQPHGDISFLPTYRVAELASEKVKMVLTGDGADELFAGYDKYKDFFDLRVNDINQTDFLPSYVESISLFDKAAKRLLFSERCRVEVENVDSTQFVKDTLQRASAMDEINQVLYIDTMLLLPGNNLVKPDRMGMAVSIENRSPFLDFRMIELAFSMPGSLKLKNKTSKYIMKKAVAPLIGDDLAYRQKQMFTVPVGDWFKTDLKPLCFDLLLSNKASERNIFDRDYVKDLLTNHFSDSENNTREIRALMALELWFREFFDDFKLA